MSLVVEHLHLRGAVEDPAGLLARSVEDPAVAPLLHPPLDLQLEIAELVLCDDVATRPDPGQRPVHDPPSIRNSRTAETPPAFRRLPVEEEAPARLPLRIGQSVHLLRQNGP